jgi:hypothetical protein
MAEGTQGLTHKPITRDVVEDEDGVVAAHLSDVVTDPESPEAVQVPDPDEYPTANASKRTAIGHVNEPSPADALDPDEAAVNEVQTISDSGTVSGGTFTLSFDGDTTDDIAYNATAAAVQAALVELASIGTDGEGNNNVAVAGGPLPGDTTVTFQNDLGGEDVALLTVDNTDITGGGTLVVAETVKGVRTDQ